MSDKLGLGSILNNMRSGNTMYDTMYNTDNSITTSDNIMKNYLKEDTDLGKGLVGSVFDTDTPLNTEKGLWDSLGLGNIGMKDIKSGVGIADDVYGLHSSIFGNEADKFDMQMDLMELKKDTLKQNLKNNQDLIENRKKFHAQWSNTPKTSTNTAVS